MGTPPVDPQVMEFLSTIPKVPQLTVESLAVIRRERAAVSGPRLSRDVEHSDVLISRDPLIRLRIHRRKGATGALPCIYSMHGGGFVVGNCTLDDAVFDSWCRQFDCIGVSVDYRLAPETPYPGPLDDCYEGLEWVHERSSELGVDPARIGLFGVSAGGGLAAGLSLLARDRGDIDLAFQLLLYPMLDDRQVTASSRWGDVPRWDPTANRFGWQSYLGALYGSEDVPYYAAPARATDLTGLPPTCVVVGTADGFYDEDIDFAQRLSHSRVLSELHVYGGGSHGFADPGCRAPIAERARRAADDWLSGHVARRRL